MYGNLEVHNRKELLSWLDKIIEGTQKAHNFHLVSDDEDVLSASVAVTPGSPVKLPTFITTRWASMQVLMSAILAASALPSLGPGSPGWRLSQPYFSTTLMCGHNRPSLSCWTPTGGAPYVKAAWRRVRPLPVQGAEVA